MVELKGCPFCGGDAEVREWDWPYVRFQVRCSKCKTTSGGRKASKSEAIAAWNHRPPTDEALATLQARGDRLAEALDEAIFWDSADSEGVSAVWLEKAKTAITEWRKGC